MSLRVTLPARSGGRLYSTVAASKTTTQWDAARPFEDIPGPKKIPILGTKYMFMPGFRKYDFNNWTRMYEQIQNDFGSIVRFSGLEPRRDMVMVYDANDIETVFRNEGIWPERPSLRSIEHYRQVVRKDFFGGLGGIFNDQGELWHKIRTMVNPVMMQPKTVQQYASKINQVSEDFIVMLPGWRDKNNEMPSDFKNELHKWALESIALIALDTRLGCLEPNLPKDSNPQKMIATIHQIFEDIGILEVKSIMWTIITTPTLKRFIANSNTMLDLSYKYVQEAMEKYKSQTNENDDKSILQRFLERDPDPSKAIVMALDMLFAGVDTTSHALTNVLLHLSANRDKQEILAKEMRKFLPRVDTPLTYDMLNEMKYLKACIKESMRLQPVAAGTARTSRNELVLSGYQIPKNVDLILPSSLLSLMEKYFPQSDKFIPERWIRGDAQAQKIHPFVSLPFGHGARKCVGMRFANMELEMMLAKMIRRFQWDFKYGPMRYETSIITGPLDPLKFTVIDR